MTDTNITKQTNSARGNEMEKTIREPIKNISESVFFILKGAKKRRTMATAKAKMIQGDLGVIPRLTAVK